MNHKYTWPLVFRALFIATHLIILSALGKNLFEVEGFGAFKIESVNEWGGIFLKYAAMATIIAAILFPIRLSFYFSGLIMGGLAMIGLKEGRDIKELAEMDGSIPDLKELVKIEAGGQQLLWGLGLSAALVIVATLTRSVGYLLSLKKKAPQE